MHSTMRPVASHRMLKLLVDRGEEFRGVSLPPEDRQHRHTNSFMVGVEVEYRPSYPRQQSGLGPLLLGTTSRPLE